MKRKRKKRNHIGKQERYICILEFNAYLKELEKKQGNQYV